MARLSRIEEYSRGKGKKRMKLKKGREKGNASRMIRETLPGVWTS
jgi:hypothetical protein